MFHLVTQPIESSNFFLYDKFHGLPRSLMYFRKQTTRFNKVRYTLLFLRTVFWNELQICSTKDIEEPIWFKTPWTYTLTVLQYCSVYCVHTHSTHSTHRTIGLCSICQNVPKHLMENQLIYTKKCNIQISPLILYPTRLLSTCLLHSLNRSHVCGNSPP